MRFPNKSVLSDLVFYSACATSRYFYSLSDVDGCPEYVRIVRTARSDGTEDYLVVRRSLLPRGRF